MHKSMPHAGPSFEINLWMLCAHCLRDIVCRLPKHLYVVDYQFSAIIALGKHCPLQSVQLRSYTLGSMHHVLKPRLVTIVRTATPHMGTASLHTLFAKRGELGSTDEETTSTPRPSNEEKPLSIKS